MVNCSYQASFVHPIFGYTWNTFTCVALLLLLWYAFYAVHLAKCFNFVDVENGRNSYIHACSISYVWVLLYLSYIVASFLPFCMLNAVTKIDAWKGRMYRIDIKYTNQPSKENSFTKFSSENAKQNELERERHWTSEWDRKR